MVGKTISHYKFIEKVGPFLKALIANKRGAHKYYLSPILILVVGLGLSLALFVVLRNLERKEAKTAFQLAASQRGSAIQKSIETKIVILESMSSLYNVAEDITRLGFYEFSKPYLARLGSVRALGWIPRIQDSQRAAFEATMRRKGFEGFQITEQGTQGLMVPASQREEYFPASDAGLEEADDAWIGFDVASEPDRLEALHRARDTGQLSVTARVALIQEREREVGFLLFVPIYRKGLPADTIGDRRKNLEGFIQGVFRIPDLVEMALSDLSSEGIDIMIIDHSAPESERVLYFHRSVVGMEPIDSGSEGANSFRDLRYAERFEIGQRQWSVLAIGTPRFIELHTTWGPLRALIVGLLFTGLLVVDFVVAARRAEEIDKTNRQLEEEIIERRWMEERLTVMAHEAEVARAKFEGVLKAAPDPIVGVNDQGQILFANDQTERLFGYQREELLGSSVRILLPEDLKEGHIQHWRNYSADPSIRSMGADGNLLGRRKDGHLIPVEVNLGPLQTEDGLVTIAIVHDSTRRKKVEDKLLQYQGQLRDQASELFFAEERERRRIATELHDRIGQTLAVARMRFGVLRKNGLSGTDARLSQELDELMGNAIQDIRSLTFELSPPTLYELGLEPTLEWLAEQTQRDQGIVCQFENDRKLLKPLNDDVSVVLYQSVRELLMNAVRHGQASHVKISLWEQDSGMGILVKDDGVGFDLSKIPTLPSTKGGFGLFNIRERLEALGGQLLILSGPNGGVLATILLPRELEKG